ncbi:MAG: hypothetical protein ACPMAQ_05350 [Phycisphaerae bacterium]
MLIVLAVGLSAYSIVSSFPWLVVTSLIWSQGLHIWMPLLGGILWTHVGYQWTFAAGSFAAAASIFGVLFIPPKRVTSPA